VLDVDDAPGARHRPIARVVLGTSRTVGPRHGVYYDPLRPPRHPLPRGGWTVAARKFSEIAQPLMVDAVATHGRPASLHANRAPP
jgi:hypothetical protein